ncbi:HU family DNA-binding protein [Bradyrhizobium sp. Arg62]|nr:HU family DNA-binding protein [Bradyrhizobium australafricanum]MCC8947833.1 HU family DNA-binding protein [Bradyrhizobium brasilense]
MTDYAELRAHDWFVLPLSKQAHDEYRSDAAAWEETYGTHAELPLAFWASIGFKPGDFVTVGMNQSAPAWFDRVLAERRRNPHMAKMTKNQLIDAIAEGTQLSKNDVRSVIEYMATVGYKELNESGEFVIPGFAKMSVVNKPATEARMGVNPFTKEPMQFAAKPASKSVKASPLKVAKDAV